MFWSLEEWQGKKGGKKDKKEKRTGACVEEKKRGKKREKEMPCVEDKKRGGKKEKRKKKYYHNFFTINFKG